MSLVGMDEDEESALLREETPKRAMMKRGWKCMRAWMWMQGQGQGVNLVLSALLLAYVNKEVVYLYIILFAHYLLKVCLIQISDILYSIKVTAFSS